MERNKKLKTGHLSDSEFRQYLKNLGFDIIECPNDGNCLYHAVLRGLSKESPLKNVNQLREAVANYLVENPKSFASPLLVWFEKKKKLLKLTSRSSLKNAVELRAQLIRTPGEWADNLEIAIITQLLQIPVRIYQISSSPILIGDFVEGRPLICISYHNNNHYNYLERNQTTKPPPLPTKRSNGDTIDEIQRLSQAEKNSNDKFISELNLKGWKVVSIDRTGNGFYQSVLTSLNNNYGFESSKDLREEVAHHLQAHSTDYEDLIIKQACCNKLQQIYGDAYDFTSEDYELTPEMRRDFYEEGLRLGINCIQKNTPWSEQIEATLTAEVLQIPIVVHRPNDKEALYAPKDDINETLSVLELNLEEIHISLHFSTIYKPLLKFGIKVKDPSTVPGVRFLNNKVFGTARQSIEHYILIYKKFDRGSLKLSLECIKQNKKKVLHTFAYSIKTRKAIVLDKAIQDMFAIYCQKIDIPLNAKDGRRYTWLSRIYITFLVSNSLRCHWNGIDFNFIFVKNTKGLPAMLLRYFWRENRTIIIKDLKRIIQNPDILFCYQCNDSCQYHSKPWHINLTGSNKIGRDASTAFEYRHTLTRYQVFDALIPPNDPNLLHLKGVYDRLSQTNNLPLEMDNIVAKLDEQSCLINEQKFYTYLILVLNGPDMDEETTIDQLLKNERIYKILYAGMCRGQEFRTSHWRNESPLMKVLSKSARYYNLRSCSFETLREAQQDEAYVIELLKLTRRIRLEKTGTLPYILLNVKSETTNLSHLTPEDRLQITTFANGNYPVFITAEDDLKLAVNERFPGCYIIEKTIEVPDVPQSERPFSDVHKTLLDIKLQNELCRSAILLLDI